METRDWINDFVAYSAVSGSPELWRRWAGYSAVSSALRRRVWTHVWGQQRFPNLYVLIVGPAGRGKTTAITEMSRLLLQLPDINSAPAMLTKEKFIEILSKSGKIENTEAGPERYCALNVFANEFSVFLRPSDIEMTRVLTDIFDCPEVWTYSVLSRDEPFRAENVYVCLIGATTPKDIAESYGNKIIGTGFFARFIMAYAEVRELLDPWTSLERPHTEKLVPQLHTISKLKGEYVFAPDARDVFLSWYRSEMKPFPLDTRLAEYVTRRPIHWLKLSMLTAASRRDQLIVTADDLIRARDLMLETEQEMPLALEATGTNPMKTAVDETHRWAVIWAATNPGKLVPEAEIRRKLSQDIPYQYIQSAIDYMIATKMLRHQTGAPPYREFLP